MLIDVEASDNVKGVRRKRRRENVTNKYLSTGSGFRCHGDGRRELYSVEAPRVFVEGLQKRSRTATEIEDCTASLILKERLSSRQPAVG